MTKSNKIHIRFKSSLSDTSNRFIKQQKRAHNISKVDYSRNDFLKLVSDKVN